jgi:META domain
LRAATGYRIETDARVLLDERGDVLARLLPGGRPTPGPDIAPSEAEPPMVTDDLRKQLAAAVALPRGLEPAEKARLVGRWVPVDGPAGSAPEAPHVLLSSEGAWSGSDGCNAQGGRWTAGAGGSLLAVAGPQTLVGCEGANVGGWLSGASRAGFAGAALVLLDSSGKELGRLKAQGG